MRIVSLVPSLTEAVASTVPGALVGATDWCVHPADLDVTRIGGTKNPRVDRIVALVPDLVSPTRRRTVSGPRTVCAATTHAATRTT